MPVRHRGVWPRRRSVAARPRQGLRRGRSHRSPDESLQEREPAVAAQPRSRAATRSRWTPELFDFIAEAMRYYRESGGAFDITVGPLMKAWGFFRGDGRVPSDELVGHGAPPRRRLTRALEPVARTIAFDEPGVELDLGGIAKGYAVDRVAALLRQEGIVAALISAGGSSVYGLGAPPGREAWDVQIQDPIEGTKIALDRHAQESCAVGRRQLREVVRERWRHLLAHHGSATWPAGAGNSQRRGPDRHVQPQVTRSTTRFSSSGPKEAALT